MYAGRIVEEATVEELFAHPRHPYTLGLLESIPSLEGDRDEPLKPIEGQPPHMAHLEPGCAFRPRCPFHIPRCVQESPPLATNTTGGRAACFVDLETTPGLLTQGPV
jgi:oligopeptide/dipeptide ABC transporter ATP-binding protein